MTTSIQIRPKLILALAIVAILFGALTVFSGGTVIFSNEAARAAGDYVPFVVWFNFLAGFAYIIAGIGLYRWQQWGVSLSMIIAAVTLLVFAGLGIHVLQGGAFEMRTVMAMAFRFALWTGIWLLASAAWKKVAGPL